MLIPGIHVAPMIHGDTGGTKTHYGGGYTEIHETPDFITSTQGYKGHKDSSLIHKGTTGTRTHH